MMGYNIVLKTVCFWDIGDLSLHYMANKVAVWSCDSWYMS